MRDKVAVLIPTRGRPDMFMQFVRSLERTTTQADLIWYLATDDPQFNRYMTYDLLRRHCGRHMGFVGSVNYLHHLYPDYAAYTWGSDDVIYTTKGWDTHILKRLKDHPYRLFHFFDGHNEDTLPRFPIVSGQWIKTLGWFALPSLWHNYCDNALLTLSNKVDGVERIDHTAFHLLDGTPRPENYNVNDDRIAYEVWLRESSKAEQRKLREAMNGNVQHPSPDEGPKVN